MLNFFKELLKKGYRPPERIEEGMVRLKKPDRKSELRIRGFGKHRVFARHAARMQHPTFALPFSKKGK